MGGEPAGEALLTLFGDVAYLAEASVPAYRRRGIQRKLIVQRLEAAREAGTTPVFGLVPQAFLALRFKRPAA